MGYLDDTHKPVLPEKAGYQTWFVENSMVMAGLINSMEPEISQGYILYNTTKDIWDAANLMYSNLGNDSKLYELSEKARTIQQGDLLVMAYFNSLNILYQEIDLYQDIVWKNLEDHATYLKLIEKERVFKFLSGLRYEFDQERGRILSSSPIPSLREVFNLIRREESRIGFMMSGLKSTTAETSALSTANQPTAGNKNIGANSVYVAGKNEGKKDDKDSLWCDHCQKPRHTRDSCLKIHGRPVNLPQNFAKGRGWNNGGGGRGWNPASGGGRGFQAVADFSKQPKQGDTGVPNPTKEQLEQFYKFIFQNSQNLTSANLAQSGNFSTALSTKYLKSDSWILDSGATDHMTGNSSLFCS